MLGQKIPSTIPQRCFDRLVTAATFIMSTRRHGHSVNGKRSLTHSTWHNMRSRCNNPNSTGYKDYGAKGIIVCERWNIFENFLEDMGERPGPNYSIERIDSTKNYEPDNCCWATHVEQARNRSMCIKLTLNGKCQTIKEWALEVGIKRQTIERRLKLGWSHYDAVMQPVIVGQKFKKNEARP